LLFFPSYNYREVKTMRLIALILLIVAAAAATQPNFKQMFRMPHKGGFARLVKHQEGIVAKPVANTPGMKGVPQVTFCNTTQTPLVINSYTIVPDNIVPNEDVTITLYTTLTETVTSGTINEVAKVDGFPIINQNYDLCTEIVEAGLSCPLAPDNYDISQTLQIGSIPISGTVNSVTKMYDQNKKMLACVQVVVSV